MRERFASPRFAGRVAAVSAATVIALNTVACRMDVRATPVATMTSEEKVGVCIEEATRSGKRAEVIRGRGAISVLELVNPASPADGGTYSTITLPGQLRRMPVNDFSPTDGTFQLGTIAVLKRDGITEVTTTIRDPKTSVMQGGVYTADMDVDNCNILTIKWGNGQVSEIFVNGQTPRDLRRFTQIAP